MKLANQLRVKRVVERNKGVRCNYIQSKLGLTMTIVRNCLTGLAKNGEIIRKGPFYYRKKKYVKSAYKLRRNKKYSFFQKHPEGVTSGQLAKALKITNIARVIEVLNKHSENKIIKKGKLWMYENPATNVQANKSPFSKKNMMKTANRFSKSATVTEFASIEALSQLPENEINEYLEHQRLATKHSRLAQAIIDASLFASESVNLRRKEIEECTLTPSS